MSKVEIAELARRLKLREFVSKEFITQALTGERLYHSPSYVRRACMALCEEEKLPFGDITVGDFLDKGEKSHSLAGVLGCGMRTRETYQVLLSKFDLAKEEVESLSPEAKALLKKIEGKSR